MSNNEDPLIKLLTLHRLQMAQLCALSATVSILILHADRDLGQKVLKSLEDYLSSMREKAALPSNVVELFDQLSDLDELREGLDKDIVKALDSVIGELKLIIDA